MARKLQAGDRAECRLFNGIEKHYYGDPWTGTILKIDPENVVGRTTRPYLVDGRTFNFWLSRKEILRRVKDDN